MSYSISPKSSNLIIIIYKFFIPEFYNWLISIVERKIISAKYSNVFFGKFKVNSFTFLKLKYFIFIKLLRNIFIENNIIIGTFSLHGLPCRIVNLFSFAVIWGNYSSCYKKGELNYEHSQLKDLWYLPIIWKYRWVV